MTAAIIATATVILSTNSPMMVNMTMGITALLEFGRNYVTDVMLFKLLRPH